MTLLLAIFVLGIAGAQIPTDKEIAADIERVVAARLHPEHIEVRVKRRSPLSRHLQRLEIAVTGFTLDDLPMQIAPPPPARHAGDPPSANPPAPRRGKQLRIVDLHLDCQRLTLKGVPIQQMVWDVHEARLPMAEVERGHLVISRAESITGALTVTETGLAQYIRTQNFPLHAPQVRLSPQGCIISGTTPWVIGVPVEVTGRIVARNGAVLFLDRPQLRVSIVPMPAFVTERVLKDVNPLADLNAELGLPLPMTVTGIRHAEGQLGIDATLEVAKQE